MFSSIHLLIPYESAPNNPFQHSGRISWQRHAAFRYDRLDTGNRVLYSRYNPLPTSIPYGMKDQQDRNQAQFIFKQRKEWMISVSATAYLR